MKRTLWGLIFLLMLGSALIFLTQCDTGDDDDNDDSGTSACDTFCNRIGQCGLGALIGAETADDCQRICDTDTTAAVGQCVLNAGNCAAVSDCLSGGDDDTADDDTADDDTGDDDDDSVSSIPLLLGSQLFLSALDYELWSQATIPETIGTQEKAFLFPTFKDEACDLAGGKMYYILDGGELVEYGDVPGYVECTSDQLNYLVGYDFTDIEGALTEGTHELKYYYVDSVGNKSNEKIYHYEVADSDTSIGATMAGFTLTDQDGNSVSLSDYDDQIVVINGYAQWCVYCGQEANELADLMQEYIDNGDDVAILGLMHEDNTGGSVDQSELQDWNTDHGWTGLIPNLNDSVGSIQEAYWWQPAFPFNMILDADHVIRVKWHGYGSGLVADAVDFLMTK